MKYEQWYDIRQARRLRALRIVEDELVRSVEIKQGNSLEF